MNAEERKARAKAAAKMGLANDGANLPDELWMQALPPEILTGMVTRLRAEVERLTRDLDEARRRRDEWRKKTEGYDELAAAVRKGIEDAGDRNLSRVFLRGALVDSEKRLAAAQAERDELREALKNIAKQHLPAEMDQSDADMADWDEGFEAVVRVARAAIAQQGEGE